MRKFSILALAAALISSTAGGQTLTTTNNLHYWLKADAIIGLSSGQAVGTWVDSSGNGFNATQTTGSKQPIYVTNVRNGLPVVRFDGTDDQMAAPSAFNTTGITAFVVGSYDTFAPAFSEHFLFQLAATNFNYHAFVRSKDFGIGSRRFSAGFGGSQLNPVVNEAASTNCFILHMLFNDGSNPQYYTNAVQITTTPTAPLPPFTTRYTNLYLGAELNSNYLDGDIAEILIYDTVLSAVDRQNVTEYLFAKYAIPEPSALTLVAVALGVWASRRKLRR